MTNAPKLTVKGFETRSYRLNPTVGSFLVASFQQRQLPGVRKIRYRIDAARVEWHVQVAADKAGFALVAAKIADVVAEHDLLNARADGYR